MGREIRRVPKGWEHPKNEKGYFTPIYNEYYLDAFNEWIAEHNEWLSGTHPDQLGLSEDTKGCRFYAQWNGNPPDVNYYLTEKWEDKDLTCFQIYENVSEGTPVSPLFNSLDELITFLTENGYSREQATKFAKSSYAPSFSINNGVIKDGINSL